MTTSRDTGPQARLSAAELIGDDTRAEIFGLVLTAGPLSRTHLAERLGLAPSTITRLLPPLLEAGYLREEATQGTGPGRPQRLLSVNVERHLVVGVKIAPTHVAAVVTDMGAQVLARAEEPIADCSPRTALATAARMTGDPRQQFPGHPGGGGERGPR
jgi:predicted ArsR family transcriptional regulator